MMTINNRARRILHAASRIHTRSSILGSNENRRSQDPPDITILYVNRNIVFYSHKLVFNILNTKIIAEYSECQGLFTLCSKL